MRSITPTSVRMPAADRLVLLPASCLVSCVMLSAAPALKIGDVQALELVQLLYLFVYAPLFVYCGLKIPTGGLWRHYGEGYFAFLSICSGLAILSLRLSFYPPPDISLLKQPLFLSASRIFELSLAVYFMIATAETLRQRPRLFRIALDVYVLVGALSAFASISAWVLLKTAGISTFLVYGSDGRARGFFNEGGPYGIFLVSVVLVALLRARAVRPVHPFLRQLVLCLLLTTLFLSRSKVGFLAAVALCGIGVMVAGSRRQKLILMSVCGAILITFLTLFEGKLYGYAYAYLNFDEALFYRPEDPSLIMGRLAASLIVPRMIAAHPVLGIGVGNYSLMRNDPDYLQGLPPVDEWDLAGMGLFGSAAEFGLPLALFLLALLLRPLFKARRRKAPAIVAVAAAFQPAAFLLGVNLNFFYPWLVAAFVLSLEPVAGGTARTLNK
jgi:hypothetical protein